MDDFPLQTLLFGLADRIMEPFCYGCAGYILTCRISQSRSARLVFMALAVALFLWMDDIWPAIATRAARMAIASDNRAIAEMYADRQQVGHAELNSGTQSGLWDIFKLGAWDIGSAIIFVPLGFGIAGMLTRPKRDARESPRKPPPLHGPCGSGPEKMPSNAASVVDDKSRDRGRGMTLITFFAVLCCFVQGCSARTGEDQLTEAIGKGDVDRALALCDADARRLTQRDSVLGAQPLALACFHGHKELAEAFLKRGADLEDKMHKGNFTPLLVALLAHHRDIVEFLIQKGADINATGEGGNTALHWAVVGKDEPLANFLIEHGAKVTAANEHGQTPLHSAAMLGLTNTASHLLARGAAVNQPDTLGVTPLMYASGEGQLLAVELLLLHGADPTQVDADGASALTIAQGEGHSQIVSRLKAAHKPPPATDHRYERVGSVEAEFLDSARQTVVSAAVDVAIDNSRQLVLVGRCGEVFSARKFPISLAATLADVVQKGTSWGQQAREARLHGNRRLYTADSGTPGFIVGFSSEAQGSQWAVYLTFSETPERIYVFRVRPAAAAGLSRLLRQAPVQQAQTKDNDRQMGVLK